MTGGVGRMLSFSGAAQLARIANMLDDARPLTPCARGGRSRFQAFCAWKARRRAEEGPLWGSDPGDAHGIGMRTTRPRSAPRSHPASGSLLHVPPIPRSGMQRRTGPRAYVRLNGRIPGNRGASRGGRGTLWDLTPETRMGSALDDAPLIGSTVASRKRAPAPRCADPCSTFRRTSPEWRGETDSGKWLVDHLPKAG
jgi:hypothetical protein